jgi:hypothetical protein
MRCCRRRGRRICPTTRTCTRFRAALGRVVPQWDSRDDDVSLVVLGEAVLRFCRVLGGREGAMLVLEDLHWADPETPGVVEYLADNLDAEPVLLLGTVQSGAPSPALGHASALRARARPRSSTCRGSRPRQSPAWSTPASTKRRRRRRSTRSCVPAATGLPLFVKELLTGPVETGGLVRKTEGGRRAAASSPGSR